MKLTPASYEQAARHGLAMFKRGDPLGMSQGALFGENTRPFLAYRHASKMEDIDWNTMPVDKAPETRVQSA